MQTIILHPNAAPVYAFLARIHAQEPQPAAPARILDCGAGGPLPPLALFHQHGFDAWGIDISPQELDRARQFCAQAGLPLHLQEGDMRCIPFGDQAFDHVYEHFSICHLNKRDTAVAVRELWRVLKPGGLCFLGFISTDTWPRSLFGEERAPGEFWGEEGGVPEVLHSMFSDDELDDLLSSWDILVKEKHVRYLREAAAETTLDDWMKLLPEAPLPRPASDWQSQYPRRLALFQYSHTYYFLRRPA